jgi:hypothetical protein
MWAGVDLAVISYASGLSRPELRRLLEEGLGSADVITVAVTGVALYSGSKNRVSAPVLKSSGVIARSPENG